MNYPNDTPVAVLRQAMNEPMDREELIDAAERSIAWLVQNDPDDTFYRTVTLDNATIQRTLKEALGFLKALRALENEPHGV